MLRSAALTDPESADRYDDTLAEVLGHVERRDNLMIGTLAKCIAPTGGRLRVVTVYDDIEVDMNLNDPLGA